MIDNFKSLFTKVEKTLSDFKDISSSSLALNITEKDNPLHCCGIELAERYKGLVRTLSDNNKHNIDHSNAVNKKLSEADRFTENSYNDLRNLLTQLGTLPEILNNITSIHQKLNKINDDIIKIEEALSIEYEYTIACQLTSFYNQLEDS